MPKDCNECKFLWFERFKIPMCLFGEMIDNTDDKPKWCPLVAVPTPHGRLIDAEKLERDIEQYHLSDGKFQHWVQVQNSIIEAEEGEDE